MDNRMMRGFPCPVVQPVAQGGSKPVAGLGVGWQNVPGQGPQFFVTVTGEGTSLSARLDYARYTRLAENLASIGQQAMLTGNLDEAAPNDPLAALEVARRALALASFLFVGEAEQSFERAKTATGSIEERLLSGEAQLHRQHADKMAEALATVEAALFIDSEQAEG